MAIRGSTIFFSATCSDTNGNPVTPETATLNLVYVSLAETKVSVSIPMDIVGNVATVEWDSNVADAKPVRVSTHVAGGGVKVVQEYTLQLTANEANTP